MSAKGKIDNRCLTIISHVQRVNFIIVIVPPLHLSLITLMLAITYIRSKIKTLIGLELRLGRSLGTGSMGNEISQQLCLAITNPRYL